jgi:predicted DCC family thiol-disulfide oxidoreductase YuxK
MFSGAICKPETRKTRLSPRQGLPSNLASFTAKGTHTKKGQVFMKVLFNSACPICYKGVCYQKSRVSAPVEWCDVHQDSSILAKYKLDIELVRERLHVINDEGQLKVGIDAFIELWRVSPKDRLKARICALPIIHMLCSISYKAVALLLYRYNIFNNRW